MARTRGRAPPLWVKVFGTIGIVLLLAFLILHLTGHGLSGHHGFGSHSLP